LVAPTISRWFPADFVRRNPPLLDQVRAMIASTPFEGFIRATRALRQYDLQADLAALRCPTAFIVGEADGVLPDVMHGMSSVVARSIFTPIATAGHLPGVEQPTLFNAALEALLARSV
jgi:3-oxoadipate enol-lactonase